MSECEQGYAEAIRAIDVKGHLNNADITNIARAVEAVADAALAVQCAELTSEIIRAWAKHDEACDEVEELRDEVKRLRAGESDEPLEDGAIPTTGQFIKLWNDSDLVLKLALVESQLRDNATAMRCRTMHADPKATGKEVESNGQANPLPEPGLWGVVMARGRNYVRTTEDTDERWRSGDYTARWDDLPDPILVREGIPAQDGPAPAPGCWVAYYHDGSADVLFATEIDALRAAVARSMQVGFVEWGRDVREVVPQQPFYGA